MKQTNKVKRVIQVLDKFVSHIDLKYPVAVTSAVINSRYRGFGEWHTTMKLKDGGWTTDKCSDFNGCLGGYSISVRVLVRDLASLRLITDKEAEEFIRWHNILGTSEQEKNKLDRLETYAAELGYKLIKTS